MAADAFTPRNEARWRSENGRLLIKRCNACQSFHHYPRPFCPHCMSDDTVWHEASGRGTVYAFSVNRQRGADPYVIAYVTLEEGVRLMTNIVDTPPEQVANGLPVTVLFREVDGEHVPLFIPAA